MGFHTPAGPKWRFILASAVLWCITWGMGLQFVYGLNPAAGWIGIGLLGGLASAVLLRRSALCRDSGRLALVVAGWVVGGCASAAFVGYSVTVGWICPGWLGGAAMGFAIGDKSTKKKGLLVIGSAAGWVAAGLVGAWIQANWGRDTGILVGQALSGPATPYVVWSVAWGVGGTFTGALGGIVLQWLRGWDRY